jgi:hypothetical protein
MKRIITLLSLVACAACGSVDDGPAPPLTTNSPGMDTGDGAATMAEDGPAGTAMDDAADGTTAEPGPFECCWYFEGLDQVWGCPGPETCCQGQSTDPGDFCYCINHAQTEFCLGEGTSPPDSSGGEEDDSSGSGGDETGGEVCDTGLYRCHGWIAGIYQRVGAPTNFEFDHGSPHAEIAALNATGVGAAQCISFDMCIPDIGDDNLDALLLDTCKEECEMMDDIVWPAWLDATEMYFPWTGETACVFAIDGNNGTIPMQSFDTAAAGGPFAINDLPTSSPKLDCTYELDGVTVHYIESPLAPYKDQVLYDGPCENSVCENKTCEDWDPAGWIQTSYSTTTKTYNVRVPEWLWDGIIAGGWTSAWACDDARWFDSTSGAGEFWSMQNIVAGDLLYELGFRNGDKMARARKTTPSTSPWYNLYGSYTGSVWVIGYVRLGYAYLALKNEPNITIEFARLVSGVWTTHYIKIQRI